MKKQFFLLSLGVGAMLLATQIAYAQSAARSNCGERTKVVERLSSHYGETRRSIALGSNNAVVEMFASATTGSWTLTVTTPNGKTCLVASGQSYEATDDTLSPVGQGI